MAQFQSDKFLADRANWDLKAHLSGNVHFGDNPLISNQTPDLASACPAPLRTINTLKHNAFIAFVQHIK
ncbi:hypothetical protein XBFFL1_2410001 [Xenorhabdus bovienii str. feltiae Florida]|nr:hypothetical protein XBFFR1_2040023 [Xenorhabdus bovienii str. feltiae France]CDG93147.1 hypothetical protein XBFFL1_2410001 [Xenorhabdus bovienii str. feltiae Florida]